MEEERARLLVLGKLSMDAALPSREKAERRVISASCCQAGQSEHLGPLWDNWLSAPHSFYYHTAFLLFARFYFFNISVGECAFCGRNDQLVESFSFVIKSLPGLT